MVKRYQGQGVRYGAGIEGGLLPFIIAGMVELTKENRTIRKNSELLDSSPGALRSATENGNMNRKNTR